MHNQRENLIWIISLTIVIGACLLQAPEFMQEPSPRALPPALDPARELLGVSLIVHAPMSGYKCHIDQDGWMDCNPPSPNIDPQLGKYHLKDIEWNYVEGKILALDFRTLEENYDGPTDTTTYVLQVSIGSSSGLEEEYRISCTGPCPKEVSKVMTFIHKTSGIEIDETGA